MKDERILPGKRPLAVLQPLRAFQPLHHVVLISSSIKVRITWWAQSPDDRSAVRERILLPETSSSHICPIVAQHPHALKGRSFGDAELRELGNERVIRQGGIAPPERPPFSILTHVSSSGSPTRRIAQQRVFDPPMRLSALADVVHHACPRFPHPRFVVPAQRKEKLAFQGRFGRSSFCCAPRDSPSGAVNWRGLFADISCRHESRDIPNTILLSRAARM